MTDHAPCRNPECRNGFTPGIITAGKGTAVSPLVGATMRWGWVKCRACSPDKDNPYLLRERSPGEIAARARLADAKAVYESPQQNLERVKRAVPVPTPVTPPAPAIVDKLLAQIDKLTDQVSSLLDENRTLRARLEAKPNGTSEAPAPRRIIRKTKGKKDELQ